MPELPEVETTLRGIKPHANQQRVTDVVIRHHGLRWPIPREIKTVLTGQVIQDIARRGKYLLFTTPTGTLILHLGMSGRLSVISTPFPDAKKHDHVDIIFANQKGLRFTDPRRFGCLLWTAEDPFSHSLLSHLGPEPFSKTFNAEYLFKQATRRKIPVKTFLMDSKIVVGVGNIYATEALFAANVHPQTAAGQVTFAQYEKLVVAIKNVLKAAIKQGGTTLKDFMKSDGKPGYFKFQLQAYGRAGLGCLRCKTILEELRLGQRSSVFCPRCQPLKKIRKK